MKTAKLIFPAVLWVFLLCTSAYAQNTSHSDDHQSKLDGPQNVLNLKYRQDFYAKKSTQLEREFSEKPWLGNSDKAAGHFSIVFDRTLGVDFPKQKKDSVLQLQREILEQKERLANMYKSGSISFEKYVEQSSGFIEVGLEKISKTLTDEEFIGLFQFEKTEIRGSFYKLINQGLPESERVVDPRK